MTEGPGPLIRTLLLLSVSSAFGSSLKLGNAERAVEWLFNHPDALLLLPPLLHPPRFAGTKDVPAKYKLKAFILHKGPSVHSGHYVAHIRAGDA
ncbi:hypothetical protein C8F04DRAFT_1261160 [Mycena alexandri]|uniref:Peptidase C19 ubiquitin carboxyl-terminal hydrolase domain-containing protein n=1 Tax=Mycena alexandri TaxID=1745969 RepID=A0AAD6WZA9_9AGAR|nr:hypothetical protein C8F04DRAFT_1261160 [Mycena alexandri]